jgi:hypothetical protein
MSEFQRQFFPSIDGAKSGPADIDVEARRKRYMEQEKNNVYVITL